MSHSQDSWRIGFALGRVIFLHCFAVYSVHVSPQYMYEACDYYIQACDYSDYNRNSDHLTGPIEGVPLEGRVD